jgi:DivIVA domain-containing protein
VALDRSSIQRSDFPTVRRGYDPAAVDRHLSEVADQMEGARRSAGQPVAAAASAQVQRIIEAAESTAEQLRTEAGDEAREHVHRVSTAARELLERIGAMHDELGALMDRMREEAGRLSTELRSLERDVGEIGAAPREAEAIEEVAAPEPAAGSRAATPASARPDPAPAEASVDAAPADAEPPADAAPSPDPRPEDEEDARIVALDMALAGTPREETERYLADHYSLADPGALLDDVYALAGS